MKTLLLLTIGAVVSLNSSSPQAAPNLTKEIPIIRKAAERNGIKYQSNDWYLLLAIRMSENGGNGKQFGIINPKAKDLDLQAAWCAATIVKHHGRCGIKEVNDKFIGLLGERYAPSAAHPLNKNWIGNVKFWYNKLKKETKHGTL